MVWGGGGLAGLSAVCFGAERMRRARNTQKRAQFRTGFGRGLGSALVASGCENERDARKSACFVRPGARAKTEKDSVKKRAKNTKNGGVKIDVRV